VFGLTSSGAIDTTFGQAGVVDVASATSVDSSCGAVAMQHDGRLLVAGNEGDRAFAIRLLGSGERDAEFTATALGAELADATAIAAVDDGSVLLAGHRVGGISGALVVRLQADGLLDTLFGDGGRTSIDLPSDHGTDPVVHDIVALPDGRVMLAGGVVEVGKEQPFLARLLGSENLNAPGIVGFARDHIAVPTGGEQSVLVRRSAGTRGAVSVNYELFQPRCEGGPWDYGCGPAHYSGTLTWGDGEAGDREVLVLTTVGSALLILDEPRGGASLANRVSVLQVEGEAPVTGVVSFETSAVTVSEELNSAVQLTLRRDYVAAGAVSVTVTPVAATALADRDFSATPIVVGWGDGDFSPKTVTITLLDDRRREGVETFTVVLGYPSNGALLWGQTTATVTINDDDRSGGSGGVGGGTVGLVSALLLGLGNLLRRALGRRGRAGTQSAVT
jgi:hypothetical protein